ncbi:hypothetical protein HF313_13635 [Massilia atriviolacea]|uniref:Uncharacterized protein n=1 Tax=Massilia atriviolacea TaxID=2495579 RepID=A0A430HQH8_9BURK|nr:hypothetical protein [Massilia atriviolacea]RSZ59781.1 hypothetical protein EJB06_06170 [Massilia atriviolacea]
MNTPPPRFHSDRRMPSRQPAYGSAPREAAGGEPGTPVDQDIVAGASLRALRDLAEEPAWRTRHI